MLDQVKKNEIYVSLMKKHHELYDSFEFPSDLSEYIEESDVKTKEDGIKAESEQETETAVRPRRSSRTAKPKKEESD